LVALTSLVEAQDRKKRGKEKAAKSLRDVSSIAKLGRGVRGNEGFFDVTIYGRDEKGKKKSTKAFLKLDDEVPLYVDRQVKIEHLKEGDKIVVFGRPVETEVEERVGGGGGGRGGRGGGGRIQRGWDRQIQNVKVLLTGDELDTNAVYKDTKDQSLKWVRSTITSTLGGIWIRHEGNKYKVVLAKRAPMIKRFRATTEKERKVLKKARYVHLNADETDSRPQTKKKSDAKKESYEGMRLIILDPRLLSSGYPLLFRT